MDGIQVKAEELETTETPVQNHWLGNRAGAKRRKIIPQMRKKSNCNTNGHILQTQRHPSIDGLQSSAHAPHSPSYPGLAQDRSPAPRFAVGGRGRRGPGMRESSAVVKLRAELERCKQENRELKTRLDEVLNLRELETTLRMTLQSFGVPLPKPPRESCSYCHGYTSSWQPEHQFQEMYSSSSEEEEEIHMPEFQEAVSPEPPARRQREYQTAVQTPQQMQAQSQPQPQLPSQATSTLYQSHTGSTRDNSQSIATNAAAASTTSQVELIPSSGIFVDSNKLSSIAYKKGWSYTLLTRSLMPMVFSRQEMESSCVRGERATGKGSLNSPARPALDQTKVQALITFVSQQFPDIQPYQITQTMNQKLVDVRGTIKKRKLATKFVMKNAAMSL